MARFIDRFMRLTTATPETVARIIVKTIEQKTRRYPYLPHWTPIFSMMRGFMPRSLYHAILYRGLPGIKTWGKF